MQISPKVHFFLLGVFVAGIASYFASGLFFAILSVLLFIYFIVVVSLHFRAKKQRKTLHKSPQSKTHKSLVKLKEKRAKEEEKQHEFITDQVAYIAGIWELSKTQERTFETFIQKRAYSELYRKMTVSLLPQLTKMIEECVARDMVGCKRDISSRLNELVFVMREEIKRKKKAKKENFETMRTVFDQLISEVS